MTDATVVAPAKINLHLRVGPARADGFHPLLTWMVTVGLSDGLTVRPGRRPGVHAATTRRCRPTGGTWSSRRSPRWPPGSAATRPWPST